jgi:probable F420-dependent oxidoreductase
MTAKTSTRAAFDVAIDPGTGSVGDIAAEVERSGFGGMFLGETCHDPLLLLAAASQTTSTLRLGTSIYVAFARSPMVTAIAANDVQALSAGRLTLGLGSQIKPHITRRFSMPWSRPAARMREYVLALRAIWGSWENSAPLRFDGEFYSHTLMTPMFDPGPNPYGNPPVIVAGVGEHMTRVAGEVADGLLVHSFVTKRYLQEVLLPNVEGAIAAAGRAREHFEVIVSPMFATGSTDAEVAEAREFVRGQIAFYGSTPAYRGVLDLHGWAGLHEDLYRLSKQGEWAQMPMIVPDEVVDEFAVSAPIGHAAAEIDRHWGPVADRISVTAANKTALSAWRSAPKIYGDGARSPRSVFNPIDD